MTDDAPGADPAVVRPYLAAALGDERWTEARISLISGGKSNLTYRVSSDAGEVILRRPPLGHVLPTAHDMLREHTAMAALGPTRVPVPRMLHLCLDGALLGQPFFVMEAVAGHVCREELPAGYAEEPVRRDAIGRALVQVLVDLHTVDAAAVGLAGFGRAEGYLERQVARWGKQWEATRVAGVDALDALAADLARTVPRLQRPAIVHGDFRLDNTVLDPQTPGRVAAVLDWEMSTLGDPLADLGVMLVYWAQADEDSVRTAAAVVPSATALPGFPTRQEVADLYASRSGLDLTELPWYLSFAFFKLAVVCAGIAARARAGAMVGAGFDDFDARVGPLVELGRRTLDERQLL
ncbi:MAG: aminoglycoside phosphotransferase [Nocardioides sp.]|nr:aminoglycoside phosphotransferase [Nocardioides sp.]